MDRPIVLIVSDEAEFSNAITNYWAREKKTPVFVSKNTNACTTLNGENFDLAIAGGLHCRPVEQLLDVIRASGRPAIYVATAAPPERVAESRVISLPEFENWPEIAVNIASRTLECQRAKNELAQVQQQALQLEQQAALGRYMLESRHNLNNALTSVLGNSDLVLLDSDKLSPTVRTQIETIRNMSMRMNEIMQRFSSLEKEMQLVEQQSGKKKAKAASA